MLNAIEPEKRVVSIDYLRGWAILGIVLVNVFGFGNSDIFRNEFVQEWRFYPLERILLFTRSNLLDNRVFPILAFLFGWGIHQQLVLRNSISALYKRQLILFFVGLFHAIFIWWGDVLMLYAVLGTLMIALRKLNTPVLIGIILSLIVFPFYRQFSHLIDLQEWQIALGLEGLNKDKLITIIHTADLYAFLKVNFIEFLNTNSKSTPYFLPKQLIMIIAGFCIGREGNIVKLLSIYSNKISIYFMLILLILLRIAGYTFLVNGVHHTILSHFLEVAMRIVELLTSSIYMLIIFKLYSLKTLLWFRKPFVSVGRMTLTNYIIHSLVGLSIFHLLRFYGELLPSKLFFIAISMFVFSCGFSVFWLKKYRNGPVEFLWRRLYTKG